MGRGLYGSRVRERNATAPAYQSFQKGTATLLPLAAAVVIVLMLLASDLHRLATGADIPIDGSVSAGRLVFLLVVLPIITVLVIASFGSLTVTGHPDRLEIRFGIGWIRRSWPIREIVGAEPVRNRWFYGWGIRWLPGAFLYNVTGLDAVELTLRGGARVRIGTPDPSGLAGFVRERIGIEAAARGGCSAKPETEKGAAR